MPREDAQKESNLIIAAVTLANHKVSGGNSFVIEASDEEEQKKLMVEVAKAVKGEVMRTSNGIYLILKG